MAVSIITTLSAFMASLKKEPCRTINLGRGRRSELTPVTVRAELYNECLMKVETRSLTDGLSINHITQKIVNPASFEPFITDSLTTIITIG